MMAVVPDLVVADALVLVAQIVERRPSPADDNQARVAGRRRVAGDELVGIVVPRDVRHVAQIVERVVGKRPASARAHRPAVAGHVVDQSPRVLVLPVVAFQRDALEVVLDEGSARYLERAARAAAGVGERIARAAVARVDAVDARHLPVERNGRGGLVGEIDRRHQHVGGRGRECRHRRAVVVVPRVFRRVVEHGDERAAAAAVGPEAALGICTVYMI